MSSVGEGIIEIGRDLLAVKASLPHGSFLPWIEAEFGMSERSARNFMNVGERFAGKSATVADLPPTALYALASAEPDVQSRIEEMLAAGEVVTKATVDALRRRADHAETEAAAHADRVKELEARDREKLLSISIEVDAAARKIEASHAEEEARLKAEIASLRKQLTEAAKAPAPSNVVALHKELSEAKKASIDAEVREGGLRDAVLFSVGANGAHGLQRTREDKRNAVLVLLNDEEWSKWSDREIARRCCVGADMVGRLRPADTVVERQYIHPKTGTISTMQVARIGSRSDPRPPVGDATSRPAPSSNVLHLGDRLAPVASERAVEKEAEAAEAAARDRSGTTKPRWATGRRGRA